MKTYVNSVKNSKTNIEDKIQMPTSKENKKMGPNIYTKKLKYIDFLHKKYLF
jgi:hypothetical protein